MYKDGCRGQQDSVEIESSTNLQPSLAALALGLIAGMEHGAIGMLGKQREQKGWKIQDRTTKSTCCCGLRFHVRSIHYSLRTILRVIDSHIRVAPRGCGDTRELSDGAASVWFFWSGREWKRKQHTGVCRHTCMHSPQGGRE